MNCQRSVRLRRSITAALIPSLCWCAASVDDTKLDRMVAAGKSHRELAQYLFDSRGCNGCHTIGQGGRLGLTKRGQEKAQGFEGCVSTLKAMTVIANVPADHRSETQRKRVERFEEFGCASCHKVTPGKEALTDLGAKLANLHLGCVDVQRVLGSARK